MVPIVDSRLTTWVTSGQDARILLSSASDVTGMVVAMSEPEGEEERCRVKRGGPVCSTESSERSLSSIQAGRYELSRDAGTVGTKKCCSAPGSVGFSSSTLLCGSLRPHTADARVTNAGPSCSGDKRTGQDCVANLRARSRRQEEKEREDLTRSSVGLAGATVDVRKGDEVILRHAAPEQLLVD